MSQFKVSFVAAAAAAFLAACGGGGGGGAPAPAEVQADTEGLAVDGYISGATVTCDANRNGRADTGETQTQTNGAGLFNFGGGCAFPIVVTGGINIDTGFPFVGTLQTPGPENRYTGRVMVTPITTLMAAGNFTAAEVATLLNLPAGTDVTRVDPANGQNPELFKKTLAVQQLFQQLGRTFAAGVGAADANAIYAIAAAQLADALKAPGAPRLLGDDGSVNVSILRTVATNVATAVNSTLSPQALAGVVDQIATQAEAFLRSSGLLADLRQVAQSQQNPSAQIDVRAGEKFVALGDSGVSLNGQSISLAQFADTGVSVTGFRELGLRFDLVGTPAVNVTTSMALEFKEDVANNPRRLQIMIDKVNVAYNATANTWRIEAADDAKVHVYGRKADGSEVNVSYNDLSFAPYTVTNNQITLRYESILNKVFDSSESAPLKSTAESFKNIRGTFITTVAVSRLNMRKPDGSALALQDITMEGGTGRVTGVGIKGKVTFN